MNVMSNCIYIFTRQESYYCLSLQVDLEYIVIIKWVLLLRFEELDFGFFPCLHSFLNRNFLTLNRLVLTSLYLIQGINGTGSYSIVSFVWYNLSLWIFYSPTVVQVFFLYISTCFFSIFNNHRILYIYKIYIMMLIIMDIFIYIYITIYIRPLLTKKGLDLIDSNYHPVSDLSFISKIVESVAMRQFNHHCEINKIAPPSINQPIMNIIVVKLHWLSDRWNSLEHWTKEITILVCID